MKVRCHGSGELGAGAASFPNFSSTACRVDGVRGTPQRVRDVPAHAVDATHTHPHTRKSAAKKKKNKAPPYMAQTTAWSRRCW